MTNTNPETGIRYGVIYMNSLDPDVANELWGYGSTQVRDLSYEAALKFLQREIQEEADNIEDEASIAIEERGYNTDREYEDLLEEEIEAAYGRRGYDSREDFIDGEIERLSDRIEIDEPMIQGEMDGVEYEISWFGGAPLLWVIKGPIGLANKLCSPCVPGAADLDSGFRDLCGDDEDGFSGYECYVIPADWLNSERPANG